MSRRAVVLLLVAVACSDTSGPTGDASDPAALSWRWLGPTPTGNPLHDIVAIEPGVFVAVGSAGTILRSDDNGLTWDDTPSISQRSGFYSADFLGSVGLAISGAGEVFRTTDAGMSWIRISRVILESGLAEGLRVCTLENAPVLRLRLKPRRS